MPTLDLSPDLQTGVVPVSKAASQLAALLKRAKATRRPIVITQKGYPTGVLLSIELFTFLRNLAEEIGAELDTTPGAE